MRIITESDAATLKKMRDELARLTRKVDGMRGPGILSNSRESIVVVGGQPGRKPRTPTPQTSEAYTVLKITGFSSPAALGGGWYWALVQKRNSTALNEATTFSSATYFENAATSSDYVLLISMAESGSATHDFSTNTYLMAWSLDDVADVGGTNYDVYITHAVSLSC